MFVSGDISLYTMVITIKPPFGRICLELFPGIESSRKSKKLMVFVVRCFAAFRMSFEELGFSERTAMMHGGCFLLWMK